MRGRLAVSRLLMANARAANELDGALRVAVGLWYVPKAAPLAAVGRELLAAPAEYTWKEKKLKVVVKKGGAR